MTETNVQPIPSNSQHHDTPNNKTHVIKFRVTAEEKTSLELTCKLLNLSLSTFIRRAIHNVKIEKTIIVAGGGEETLTAVSTLLAQCSKVGGNLNQLARHFNSGGADTEQIRAKHLGDKFDKVAVLATLQANAERKPKAQFKQDTIGKLTDIQSRMTEGKGIGYERWAKKHNLKAIAQTLILLQEKGLLNEDALDQRIAELDTKFHESLAVVKDLETRMANNQTLRRYAASYKQYRPLAQKRNAAKSPATFEEQHRAELTAYRTAAAYLKANNITKLPSPNKLEAEYCALASEKAQFYEQYKEAKIELLKLKDAKQNVALFFREDERTQHHER